jgi:putative transposase
MVSATAPPQRLATDGLLAQFSTKRKVAIQHYAEFVTASIRQEVIWKDLNHQVFLGNDQFVERMQAKHEDLSRTVGVPKLQKHPPCHPLNS